MGDVIYIRARTLHRDKPDTFPGAAKGEQFPPVRAVYCEAIGWDGGSLGMQFYAAEEAIVTQEKMQKAARDMATDMARRGGFVPRGQQ